MSKTLYQKFIVVDISKREIAVGIYDCKESWLFGNDERGWSEFWTMHKANLQKGLVVVETTGGHELGLVMFLQRKRVAVHRANARQVKYFIRSFGTLAKNDRLDANALATYGYERQGQLEIFTGKEESFELYELAQRRSDLKGILVQEKNRLQSPRGGKTVKDSCAKIINIVENQIKEIDEELQRLIDKNPELQKKQEILQGLEGIGPVVSRELICYMPELGRLNQKEVASLAGVAPHANESGMFKGARRVKGGRQEVKKILFMAAMSARNTKNSRFQIFYKRLVESGKKPIVALVALMRKLIVIANARIKEWLFTMDHPIRL